MAAVWFNIQAPYATSRAIQVPDYNTNMLGQILALERLPTEPIGTTTVTFKGVNTGSEIRVFYADGTEAAGVDSGIADQALSWNVYAAGSANNTVTIRIINFLYKIKEFVFLSSLGNVLLPVQQDRDKWALNPT